MTACRRSDQLVASALTYASCPHLQGEVPRMPPILGSRRSKDIEISRGENERVEDLGDEGDTCIRQLMLQASSSG
jgi:hypothetical protein